MKTKEISQNKADKNSITNASEKNSVTEETNYEQDEHDFRKTNKKRVGIGGRIPFASR